MKRQVSALLAIALVAALVVAAPASAQPTHSVPEAKQTSLSLYVTAKEAYEKWRASPDTVKVIDVRSPEEYVLIGHAEMAFNVPLGFITYEWDEKEDHFAVDLNEGLVSEVREFAAPDDTLLVMCRSGGRSAMAVNVLAKAGFKNVFNIVDGFEGDKVDDPQSVFHGKRLKNGWKNSAPWTYDFDFEQMRLPAGR